jgi:hypothetical protein
MRISAPFPRRWSALAGTCLLWVLLLFGPAPAAEAAQRWTVTDQAGHRWTLTLFEQPDPDFPPGWRLRLNALTADVAIDHDRPLRLRDGMGGTWQLANRSVELVPAGAALIPAGSAQFDAVGLEPRPSEALPLGMVLPLADGTEASLTLGAEIVPVLHDLPPTPRPQAKQPQMVEAPS